jgi:hypothetical protein
MRRIAVTLLGLASIPPLTMGCGLDWTLPTNHFDGVEEHGYVSYWEKIGEADLGDGLVIPVNINFNSHREASSPYLGKGWTVALLESHVEPLDENNMKVIMPDGWNFYFQRDGNAETWHGNAGWVGQTNDTVFTITAPCGWRIKFDGGKIQEIDSNKNRVLTYKYNGPVAAEVDVDGKAFLRVESSPATSRPEDILVGSQRIGISLAQRPQVMTKLTENLVTGFDPSLSQLQWPDGGKEIFAFGTVDKTLDPTLAIVHRDQTQRNFTWDATTRQIKTDGEWAYQLVSTDPALHMGGLRRVNNNGDSESYFLDNASGIEVSTSGPMVEKRGWFTSGPLAGLERYDIRESNGEVTYSSRASYNEKGKLIREQVNGIENDYAYDAEGRLTQIEKGGKSYLNFYYSGSKLIKIESKGENNHES